MPHRFRVMVKGQIVTFQRFEDIPQDIEHVIEFAPDIPPPPHTDQEHAEIETWHSKFKQLMEREHASSSQKR